jgi:ComF family protein
MFLHRRHLSSRRLCLLTPETHCMQSCVSYLRDAALALLYPTLCRVCGKPVERWADGIACAACWESAEEFSARACFCPKCGIVLQVPLPGGACGRCEALSLKGARSCGPYDGALCESVRWLKSHPQIANRLGGWLAEEGEALAAAHNCELIIPVPLHPARLKERGFNQAEIVALPVARRTRIQLSLTSLVRTRLTERHRAGMGPSERARSVKGAFRVRAPRVIESRSVLVVDDVMTSGATAEEVASCLYAAGARSVCLLTIARAIIAHQQNSGQ